MTIATRFPKSWSIPKFDIKDSSLELYLPLWYPYSDMTGSTIYSYDGNRITGTVTDATWGSQGRTFNGTSALINCGRITQIEGAAALWTIRCWHKLTDTSVSTRCLLSYDDNEVLGAGDLYIYWNTSDNLRYQIGGGEAEQSVTTWGLTNLGWHLTELSKTATNVIIRVDGVELANIAFTGGAFTSSHTFRIGDNSNINFWKGDVGEVYIIASRTGSLAEHIQYWQATKWRY